MEQREALCLHMTSVSELTSDHTSFFTIKLAGKRVLPDNIA